MLHRSKSESVAFASNPGNRFYTKRHGEVQIDGTLKLVDDETIDLQEQYNAEYPATTIENILANSSPAEFFGDDGQHSVDATMLPTTLAEFMNLQIQKRMQFDSLPAAVKEKFSNDFNQFLATAGSDEWFNKLGVEFVAKDNKVSSDPVPLPSDPSRPVEV